MKKYQEMMAAELQAELARTTTERQNRSKKSTNLKIELAKAEERVVFLADKLKKKTAENNMVNWVRAKERSCYVCRHSQEIYERYIDTFFVTKFHICIQRSRVFIKIFRRSELNRVYKI